MALLGGQQQIWDIYARVLMKSLFIPFYWSKGGTNRVKLMICIMALLEEVMEVDASLCKRWSKYFISTDWHWLLILYKIIHRKKKSKIQLKYFTAVSHSQDLCCRTQQNRPCVGGWPRRSHSCRTKGHFFVFCAVPTAVSSETAAADCVAWSYLWLRASLAELAGDRSSHSGRRPLTGDNPSIILVAPLNSSKRLNGCFVSLSHSCIRCLGISR